jgi:pimeloyl-ACP methyl ester carboxylesterase
MVEVFPNTARTTVLQKYARRPPLILINGLAEQAETWYANLSFWRRYFDVFTPNLLVFDGAELHRRIEDGLPISVDYLVDQLHWFLEKFVQSPPYHLAASSMGAKVVVEYTHRYPDRVRRLVLICPSGLGDEEKLPTVSEARRSDVQSLVRSVFFDPEAVDQDLLSYYETKYTNRRWRLGLLRTIRGTMADTIRQRLSQLAQPTLIISGRHDRIVSTKEAERASRELPRGRFVRIPRSGHAPQIEKAEIINPMVVRFLKAAETELPDRPGRLMETVS